LVRPLEPVIGRRDAPTRWQTMTVEIQISNSIVHRHSIAILRRMRASLDMNIRSLKAEGAGNAGRPLRPQPRVQNKIKHTSVVTTVTPVHPAFPAQWF
jgi:hypothetical protein